MPWHESRYIDRSTLERSCQWRRATTNLDNNEFLIFRKYSVIWNTLLDRHFDSPLSWYKSTYFIYILHIRNIQAKHENNVNLMRNIWESLAYTSTFNKTKFWKNFIRHVTRNEVISRTRGRTNIAYYLSLSTMQSRAHTYRSIDHAGIVSRMYCKMQPSVSQSVSIIQRLSCNTLEMNLATWPMIHHSSRIR